jgi:DNA-binding beta-propeller fold protein YncE
MQRFGLIALAIVTAALCFAQEAGSYKVLKTARVGGAGGFDYVVADEAGRKLYVARSGVAPRVTVFDLDTLAPVGEIPNVSAHGVVVSSKSNHGFASSKPLAMFDATTLAPIKTIDLNGHPDGLLYDAFNDRVYVLSHSAPNATVINASDGSIAGTIDLSGAPEQAATDGMGHIYVDIEDKENIAVIDAKTMTVTAHFDLTGSGGTCAGLALDVQHQILFAACRAPQNMVILSAKDGKVITTLPIGRGCDGAGFNPKTMEAFSSQGDGTLTIIKERSSSSFSVEQTVQTKPGAKTMTLDANTNRIFLIAAEYGPAPTTPIPEDTNGRIGRGPMLPDSFSIVVVGK